MDRLALHDGDRIQVQVQVLDLAQAYDPDDRLEHSGERTRPHPHAVHRRRPGPAQAVAAARILEPTADRPHTSTALRHAV